MKQMNLGSITGTGAAIAVNVGFKPETVILINVTDTGMMIWTKQQTDAYSYRTKGSDGIETYETSGGITPTALGFTLGTDSEMNGSSDTIHWVAFRGIN